jgi:hypothetical protein
MSREKAGAKITKYYASERRYHPWTEGMREVCFAPILLKNYFWLDFAQLRFSRRAQPAKKIQARPNTDSMIALHP